MSSEKDVSQAILAKRIGAFLLDIFILVFITSFFLSKSTFFYELNKEYYRIPAQIIAAGYFFIPSLLFRGTLGKRIFNLQIVTDDLQKVPFFKMIFREIIVLVSFTLLPIAVISLIFASIYKGKTLHDLLLKTRVIPLKIKEKVEMTIENNNQEMDTKEFLETTTKEKGFLDKFLMPGLVLLLLYYLLAIPFSFMKGIMDANRKGDSLHLLFDLPIWIALPLEGISTWILFLAPAVTLFAITKKSKILFKILLYLFPITLIYIFIFL